MMVLPLSHRRCSPVHRIGGVYRWLLLAATICVSRSETVNAQPRANVNGFPPAWHNIDPVSEGEVFVVEPWSYMSRLKAYKTLIDATQHCYYGAQGDGNILWGLALQFGWQYSTGRLHVDEQGQIPIHNWWSNMNYCR